MKDKYLNYPFFAAIFSGNLKKLLIGALLIFCLFINIDMLNRLRLDNYISHWASAAIPVALSSMNLGNKSNYTGLVDAKEIFLIATRNSFENKAVDAGISAILSLQDKNLSTATYLLGTDDKGIVDYIKVAFYIFGYQSISLIYLYGFLLFLSSLIFYLRFSNNLGSIVTLTCFLLAHAYVMPPVTVNSQLQTFLALRFMSTLAMIPTLYLMFEMVKFTTPPHPLFNNLIIFFGLIQLTIILFILQVRFSSIWLVVCIISFSIFIFLTKIFYPLTSKRYYRLKASLGITVLLILGLISLSKYKHYTYDQSYFEVGGASHVFWHSIYSGLSYHPQYSKENKIYIDDNSVIEATGSFLISNGRQLEWASMGGLSPNYSEIKYTIYDNAVKDMVISSLTHEPHIWISAFFYYKPLELINQVGWLLGFANFVPNTEVLWEGAGADLSNTTLRMEKENKRLDLARATSAIILFILALITLKNNFKQPKLLALLFFLFTLTSLLPSLVGYPAPHTIFDSVITAALIFYFIIFLIIRLAIKISFSLIVYYKHSNKFWS
jgi:hypothetical protein